MMYLFEKEIDLALSKVSVFELEERKRAVREAQEWINTPYHANGDVKGAGIDCGMFLVRVFCDTGLVDNFDPRPYPIQWAFHQKAERYLEIVERFGKEIEGPPLPGDLALFKVGHCWAHGSIVVAWPQIIHANPPGSCRYENVEMNLSLSRMKPRFFSIWAK